MKTKQQKIIEILVDKGVPPEQAKRRVKEKVITNLLAEGSSLDQAQQTAEGLINPQEGPQSGPVNPQEGPQSGPVNPQGEPQSGPVNPQGEPDTSTWIPGRGQTGRGQLKPSKELQTKRLAEELRSDHENVYQRYHHYATALFGSDKQRRKRNDQLAEQKHELVQILRENGVQAYIHPDYGTLGYNNDQGQFRPIDSSFIQQLSSARGELIGGIGGTLAGVAIAAKKGFLANPIPHPAAKLISGVGAGIAAAGAIGAGTGSLIDYYRNTEKLQLDQDAEIAMYRMIDAGVFSLAMEAAVGVAWKTASPYAKPLIAKLGSVWDNIVTQNREGAREILNKMTNLDPDNKQEVFDLMNKHHENLNFLNDLNPQALEARVIGVSQPKTVPFLAKADNLWELKSEVINRRKEVAEVSNLLMGGKETPDNVIKSLRAYAKTTENNYSEVINKASKDLLKVELDTGKKFTFDPETFMNPLVYKRLMDGTPHPELRHLQTQLFELSTTDDKNFDLLMLLRKAVGDNKRALSAGDITNQKILNQVKANIDMTIRKQIPELLGFSKGNVWLKYFDGARGEFTKLRKAQASDLGKIIFKESSNDIKLEKALDEVWRATKNEYNPYLKEAGLKQEPSLMQPVLDVLSPDLRIKTEGVLIKYLENKSATPEYVNFVTLNNLLDRLQFTSKGAKDYKKLINEYSKIFSTDPNIIKIAEKAGNATDPAFLSNSILFRINMLLVNKLMGYMKSVLPTENAKKVALTRLLSKVVQEPLNSVPAEKFISAFPKQDRQEFTDALQEFRAAYESMDLPKAEPAEPVDLSAKKQAVVERQAAKEQTVSERQEAKEQAAAKRQAAKEQAAAKRQAAKEQLKENRRKQREFERKQHEADKKAAAAKRQAAKSKKPAAKQPKVPEDDYPF